MVILHVKHSDTNQFLFDTRLDLPVETVITEMVELDNMRIKLDNLATYTEALI